MGGCKMSNESTEVKVVGEIFQTYDYDMFKFMKGNRKI
jgi:hypothetical protein